MNDTAGALAYLISRTTWNRVARQAARIKSPRYALMVVLGAAYFWMAFARQPSAARVAAVPAISATLQIVAAVLLAFTVAGWWLLGKVTSAFAFHPAEVQLLFPAPISRAELITYRVIRSQLVLLLNALVWTFLLSRFGIILSWPLRFATAWAFFSILSLHRLGTALVQTPGAGPLRRGAQWFGKGMVALVLIGILAGTIPTLLRLGQLAPGDIPSALAAAVARPPASVALAPFQLLLAPFFAARLGTWASAYLVVLVVLAVHLGWVLAMNVDFEEAAAVASVALASRMAAFRARRTGGPVVVQPGTKARGSLPLAPSGAPAVAIVWKNTVALTRTTSTRGVVILIVLAVVAARVMMSAGGSHNSPMDALPFGAVAAMILLMGPRALRNDLRQDLLHLSSLKSYPLSGTTLVAAEMASPVLLLTAFEVALVIAGFFTVPAATRATLDGATTAVTLVVAPIALLVLTAASIGLQNAAALLLPSWVRLGADSAGIEAMGQNLVLTFGSVFALMLGLIGPAIAGAGAYFLVRLGAVALPTVVAAGVGVLAGSMVLGGEVALLVRGLGGAFERIDQSALA